MQAMMFKTLPYCTIVILQRGAILLVCFLTVSITSAQLTYYHQDEDYSIDSLRAYNQQRVSPSNDVLELAANLALTHYPQLAGHKIKIIYRKSVTHPITAGYSAGNIFRFRKHHVYRLVLHPNAFVGRLSLNRQVSVLGHEMAHFTYYKKRPAIGMLWWGLRYITSRKFRYRFERDADRIALDHGLGGQLLELSMYMSNAEVRQYLEEKKAPASSSPE